MRRFIASRCVRGILVNSVDDPPHCDFYFGSVVRRGDLQVAISTAGESPAVAQQLRREIDEQLPADLGPWLTQVGQLRREILATHPAGEERKALLHRIARRQILQPRRERPGEQGWRRQEGVSGWSWARRSGLLTVKAQRLIRSADVILHDDLVTPEILGSCGSGCGNCERGQALRCQKHHAGRDQFPAGELCVRLSRLWSD